MILLISAPRAPKLVERFGSGAVAASGVLGVALGLFILSRLQVDGPVAATYLAIAPMAFGMGVVISPLTASIKAAVPLASPAWARP